MSPELLIAFKASVSPLGLGVGLTGFIAGAALFTGMAVPALGKILLPEPRETRLGDVLPFESVMDDGETIVCKNGTLARVLEVKGIDVSFLTPAERESYFLSRKNWIDSVSEMGIRIRAFTIRSLSKIDEFAPHQNILLKNMAKRWNASFERTWRNRQILVISMPGKSKAAYNKLDEACELSKNILDQYKPYILNQNNEDPEKRPLSVYGRIASPITRPTPGGTGLGASYMITADQAEFTDEKGFIIFRNGEQETYCSVIGLRSLGDFTDEGFVAELSALPGELVIMHAVEPMARTRARFVVGQHSRVSLAQRFSLGVASQFDEAMDMIEGSDENAQAISNYAMTIFVYGSTKEELLALETEVKKACATYGITPARDGAVAQSSWFSQFPSFETWPRVYKFFSRNVASHITLDRPPQGLQKSDWGNGPIAMFRTASGTAYSFQFHVSEEPAAVAHAVTIGPTGGGKTTLISFLTAMAMRHQNLRSYIIDRHGGAYIFTNAVGGSYNTFDGSTLKGKKSELNPFQCTDSPENRSFLLSFMQALADVNDAESIEEIGFAIESVFETPGMPKDQRSLKNIFDAVFSKSKPLRKQLQKWVDPSVFGHVFNADRDTLDLSATRLMAFDFTRIYEHEDLARAVILYLMHRIQTSITELKAPALIFIDETEPIVKHPIFRNFYLQMLQEYRKKGAAVISAFQRPEAIAQAGLGEAIRGQAQTTFFLPNVQAKEKEYEDWDLTDREMAFIKGRLNISKKLKRAVLIKRATGESVILDVDLTPLGPYLKVFRSDEPSKAEAQAMMDKFDTDWLAHYLGFKGEAA